MITGIAAQVGFQRCPGRYGGPTAIVAGNGLEQQFHASRTDQIWDDALFAIGSSTMVG